jgi:hypothetical protein
MVVLSSERAGRRSCDDGEMRPQVKNEWIADNAAEVIGGVDMGERMRARNGDSIEVNGISWISIRQVKKLIKSKQNK